MKRAAQAFAAALLVVGLVGCTGDSDVVADPTSAPTVGVDPSADPTPTEPTPREAALEVYLRYWDLLKEANRRQQTAGVGLEEVTTDKQIAGLQKSIDLNKANDLTTSGETSVSPKVTSEGDLLVRLSDCFDTSDVKTVDAQGNDVRAPGVPLRVPATVEVRRASQAAPWLVTDVNPDYSGKTC